MSDHKSDRQQSAAQTLGISPDLLDILACPVDHASLEIVEEGLRCTACGRHYPVRDGIPSMVVDAER